MMFPVMNQTYFMEHYSLQQKYQIQKYSVPEYIK